VLNGIILDVNFCAVFLHPKRHVKLIHAPAMTSPTAKVNLPCGCRVSWVSRWKPGGERPGGSIANDIDGSEAMPRKLGI